jgi:hypothetical protein
MVEAPMARFRVRLALFSTLITCAFGACVGEGCAVGSATGAAASTACCSSTAGLVTVMEVGMAVAVSVATTVFVAVGGRGVSVAGGGNGVLVKKVGPRSREIPQLNELTIKLRINIKKAQRLFFMAFPLKIPMAELPIVSLYTCEKFVFCINYFEFLSSPE